MKILNEFVIQINFLNWVQIHWIWLKFNSMKFEFKFWDEIELNWIKHNILLPYIQ
jgi:hypothetical protein